MSNARLFWFTAAGLAVSGLASGGGVVKPTAATFASLPLAEVPRVELPPIDLGLLAMIEDAERADGLPARFALEQPVLMTPDTHGVWEQADGGTVLWRLRVSCPNAVSLNFGFTRFVMPEGGRLYIHEAEGDRSIRPFTEADNDAHGELWTPSTVGGDVILEVTLPFERQHELDLEIGQINTAYRGFGMGNTAGDWDTRSGSCNVDVVCAEGDDWRAEIPSSGVYTVNGVWYCSGALINNVREDQTPYFLTADHCGVGTGNDQSVVVYWNYENTWCRPPGSGASGGGGDGPLDMFSSGTIFRAGRGASDFTLVEIEDPLDPAWALAFSGFDATGADADTAVAIHHPNTDEKRISFEYQATTTTGYLGNAVPGDGTHVRVIDWDVGTTEPGSSGSPLYNQDHRIIGQLHGGYASCSSQTSDWYGKMSVSWDAGSSSSSRLRDWLDPGNTGVRTVDTLWPAQTGMSVRGAGFAAEGARGGPFEPASAVFTVKNNLDIPISIDVDCDAEWIDVTLPASFIPEGGAADVLVSLNDAANTFGNGHYEAAITFVNMTDHDGDTVKTVTLDVGVPVPVHVFDLTTSPAWSAQGAWAFGQPTGGGGQYGGPDPTSGFTGANVYGYNLNGDYTNNMAAHALTTGAIDCSDLTNVSLRFMRWLNVEQPAYDHASIEVSNDGSAWHEVWANGEEITDSSWQEVEYDIASHADNQPTLFVRWIMGSTDGSWLYSGWNIDDVEILGVGPDTCPADLDGDGVLDLADIQLFIDAFVTQQPLGDLAEPFGVWDLADVQAFITAFTAGCP